MRHKHAIGLNGRIARADGAAARYPDLTSHKRVPYEETLSPSVSHVNTPHSVVPLKFVSKKILLNTVCKIAFAHIFFAEWEVLKLLEAPDQGNQKP